MAGRKKIMNLVGKLVDKAGPLSKIERRAKEVVSSGRANSEAGAKFFKEFGERETFKYFGPQRAKAFMKKARQLNAEEKAKIIAGKPKPIVTPLGKTKARKVIKEKSKAESRAELQKGMRKRPEEATTTVIGQQKGYGPSSSGVKPTRKALKAAKKESEKREPQKEFIRRIGREAEQGGVEIPRNFSKPRDPGATPDQIRDAMRGKIKLTDEQMENVSAEDLIKIYEAGGNTAKKYKGGSIRGAGKASRGYGKALMRSCGGSMHYKKKVK